MDLLDMIRKRQLTIADLAKELDVSTSQIYRWNKKGITAVNPHFRKLKEIIPEIQAIEKEDGRCRSGRKPKQLKLTETDLPSYQEPEFKSEQFPKIYLGKLLENYEKEKKAPK